MPPLPKTCPKTVSDPEGGVAFVWKAFLKKNFQVPERVLLSAQVAKRNVVNDGSPA
jgi:hypothetical protein